MSNCFVLLKRIGKSLIWKSFKLNVSFRISRLYNAILATPLVTLYLHSKSYLTELPWNQATLDISDYSKWKENDIETSHHWQRVQDNLLLGLVKKMLTHSPSKRYNLDQIKNNLWYKKKFKDSGTVFFVHFETILDLFIILVLAYFAPLEFLNRWKILSGTFCFLSKNPVSGPECKLFFIDLEILVIF